MKLNGAFAPDRSEIFRPQADDRVCTLLQIPVAHVDIEHGVVSVLVRLPPSVVKPHFRSSGFDREGSKPGSETPFPAFEPLETRRRLDPSL